MKFFSLWKNFIVICILYNNCYLDAAATNSSTECISVQSEQTFSLSKNGLHRELKVDVLFSVEDYNGETVLLELDIPSGMYVDPHQVESLKNIQFYLNSKVDVEIPEYKSSPFKLYIYLPVQKNKVHVKFPIHVRYHMPHWCTKDGVILTKFDLQMPTIYIKIDDDSACNWETMAFKCKPTSDLKCLWFQVKPQKVITLKYEVPVGCKEHTWIVIVGTAATFLIGFGYILYTIFQATNKQKSH